MHALILNFLFINLLFFLQICSKDVGIYQGQVLTTDNAAIFV